jgi:hypothetical protein
MEYEKTMRPPAAAPAASFSKPRPKTIDHEAIYGKIEEVEVELQRVDKKLDNHLIEAMGDHEKLCELEKTTVKHDETLYTGSNEGAPGLVVVMGGFNEFVKDVRYKMNVAYWTMLVVGILLVGSMVYLSTTLAALKVAVAMLPHP